MKGFNVKSIKCPFCDGAINAKWFDKIIGGYAYFIAECWTPSYSEKPRHIFSFAVALPDTIYVDRNEGEDGVHTYELREDPEKK